MQLTEYPCVLLLVSANVFNVVGLSCYHCHNKTESAQQCGDKLICIQKGCSASSLESSGILTERKALLWWGSSAKCSRKLHASIRMGHHLLATRYLYFQSSRWQFCHYGRQEGGIQKLYKRDWTWVSCTAERFFTILATREAHKGWGVH